MRPCSWPPIQRPMKAIRASFVPSTMPGKCAGNSFPESKRQSWPFFFQLVKHPHTPHFSFRPPRTLICSTRTLGHSLTALPLDIIQTLITSIHLPSRIYFNYFETPYPTNARLPTLLTLSRLPTLLTLSLATFIMSFLPFSNANELSSPSSLPLPLPLAKPRKSRRAQTRPHPRTSNQKWTRIEIT